MNKHPKNGFGKKAGVILLATIHVILGVLIGITFGVVKDPILIIPLLQLIAFIIYIIICSWASISNYYGFPIFKALRKIRNPVNSSKKGDIIEEKGNNAVEEKERK